MSKKPRWDTWISWATSKSHPIVASGVTVPRLVVVMFVVTASKVGDPECLTQDEALATVICLEAEVTVDGTAGLEACVGEQITVPVLVMAGEDCKRLGIYGFGAAAHIVTQIARYQQREVYAFTSPGDETAQAFALEMGARWAGGSAESSA